MRATRRHSIIATMSKGLEICFSYKKIERIIHKIFGRFEAKIKFRRLFAATNSVLFHLGYLPLMERDFNNCCCNLQIGGILTRIDGGQVADWNNPNWWVLPSGRVHGIYAKVRAGVSRLYGSSSKPYDQWEHISFEMDPLHRFAAAL